MSSELMEDLKQLQFRRLMEEAGERFKQGFKEDKSVRKAVYSLAKKMLESESWEKNAENAIRLAMKREGLSREKAVRRVALRQAMRALKLRLAQKLAERRLQELMLKYADDLND